MTQVEGGLRDRLVSESLFRLVEFTLDGMGWYDMNTALLDSSGVPYTKVSLIPGPIQPTQKIPFNTVAVTFEDIDPQDMEIGSNAQELTHVAYVDVYGQDEAIAKHVIGDIRASLAGQLASIGRNYPKLDVLDYSSDFPTFLFSCELTNVQNSRVHRTGMEQPWQRFWFTARVDVVEERFPEAFTSGSGYGGGYAGGY